MQAKLLAAAAVAADDMIMLRQLTTVPGQDLCCADAGQKERLPNAQRDLFWERASAPSPRLLSEQVTQGGGRSTQQKKSHEQYCWAQSITEFTNHASKVLGKKLQAAAGRLLSEQADLSQSKSMCATMKSVEEQAGKKPTTNKGKTPAEPVPKSLHTNNARKPCSLSSRTLSEQVYMPQRRTDDEPGSRVHKPIKTAAAKGRSRQGTRHTAPAHEQPPAWLRSYHIERAGNK